jgi:hypothetical protein
MKIFCNKGEDTRAADNPRFFQVPKGIALDLVERCLYSDPETDGILLFHQASLTFPSYKLF